MSQTAAQQNALQVSSATTELVTKILAKFPQAQIRPRTVPLTDEDISLEIALPMSMEEIYQAREWIYDVVIDLQNRYNLIIMASAVPQEQLLLAAPK
jgi:hypothetical protein